MVSVNLSEEQQQNLASALGMSAKLLGVVHVLEDAGKIALNSEMDESLITTTTHRVEKSLVQGLNALVNVDTSDLEGSKWLQPSEVNSRIDTMIAIISSSRNQGIEALSVQDLRSLMEAANYVMENGIFLGLGPTDTEIQTFKDMQAVIEDPYFDSLADQTLGSVLSGISDTVREYADAYDLTQLTDLQTLANTRSIELPDSDVGTAANTAETEAEEPQEEAQEESQQVAASEANNPLINTPPAEPPVPTEPEPQLILQADANPMGPVGELGNISELMDSYTYSLSMTGAFANLPEADQKEYKDTLYRKMMALLEEIIEKEHEAQLSPEQIEEFKSFMVGMTSWLTGQGVEPEVMAQISDVQAQLEPIFAEIVDATVMAEESVVAEPPAVSTEAVTAEQLDAIERLKVALSTQGTVDISALFSTIIQGLPEELDTYGEVADGIRLLIEGARLFVGDDMANNLLSALEKTELFQSTNADVSFEGDAVEVQRQLETLEGVINAISAAYGGEQYTLTDIPAAATALLEEIIQNNLLGDLADTPIDAALAEIGMTRDSELDAVLVALGMSPEMAAQLDQMIANSDSRMTRDSTVQQLIEVLEQDNSVAIESMADLINYAFQNAMSGSIREVKSALDTPVGELLEQLNVNVDMPLTEFMTAAPGLGLNLPESLPTLDSGTISWAEILTRLQLPEDTTLAELIVAVGGNMDMTTLELLTQLGAHLKEQILNLDLKDAINFVQGNVPEVSQSVAAPSAALDDEEMEVPAAISTDVIDTMEEVDASEVAAAAAAVAVADGIGEVVVTTETVEEAELSEAQVNALAIQAAELINYFRNDVDMLSVNGAYTDTNGVVQQQDDHEAGSRRAYAYGKFMELDDVISTFKDKYTADSATEFDDNAIALVETLQQMGLNMTDVEGLINSPDANLISPEALEAITAQVAR